MNTADQLIAGYTAYTDAQEVGASASAEAPATTPTIITASSPECGAFTVSVVSGAVGATANWGC
ncbi:LxmA leader domain family RiPP [Kitasatospora sp. NPDC086791]|uniref:LxmA leader domain family RiPP n=1 Tax=Kitasatospora sp. NPDC086791 TaxID=3155178 RepID=UPI0034240072